MFIYTYTGLNVSCCSAYWLPCPLRGLQATPYGTVRYSMYRVSTQYIACTVCTLQYVQYVQYVLYSMTYVQCVRRYVVGIAYLLPST